ncbi:MAG TPA: hypothetical protein VIW80_04855 [Pyrinomonadaceae bacterium]
MRPVIKSSLLCLSFLICAATCAAQAGKPQPAAPVAEGDPQAWKEYSSTEGRFSISFPGKPSQETKVLEGSDAQVKLNIYRLKTLAEYSVMHADYPIPMNDPAVAKLALDEGAKGAVASINSELLEINEITLDGNPGRFLKERMTGGEILWVRIFLVGQRMYQIAVTTPREEGLPAQTVNVYKTAADKFLNSFKLLKEEKPAGGKP